MTRRRGPPLLPDIRFLPFRRHTLVVLISANQAAAAPLVLRVLCGNTEGAAQLYSAAAEPTVIKHRWEPKVASRCGGDSLIWIYGKRRGKGSFERREK